MMVRDLCAGQCPGICLAPESRARQTWYGCDVTEGCLYWCLGADTLLGHRDWVSLLLALFLPDGSIFDTARKLEFSTELLTTIYFIFCACLINTEQFSVVTQCGFVPCCWESLHRFLLRLAKCFLQDAHERHSVLAEAVVCHLCLESSGSTKTESNVS